ncbi:MAG: hypothetical protein ABSA46_09385 [Thermodesulfovibrionales bacterium]
MRNRIYGRTKPGTLLKHQIPIRTDNWDVNSPGSGPRWIPSLTPATTQKGTNGGSIR